MSQNKKLTELEKLSALAGIIPEYENQMGRICVASTETKRAMLAAMELPADDEETAAETARMLNEKPWKRMLPPVKVIRVGQAVKIPVTLPSGMDNEVLSWSLEEENGKIFDEIVCLKELAVLDAREISGRKLEHRKLYVPIMSPIGYHKLRVDFIDDTYSSGEMTLIIVPKTCYVPPSLENGGRTWGFPLQAYALRSNRNWGMGDFTDVANMVEIAGELGAGTLGINPVNTLFPENAANASPYGSSCRLFINTLYIDVEAVLEFEECKEAKNLAASKEFSEKLKKARDSDMVDYETVAFLKNSVLELLYNEFRKKHLASKHTERGAEFRAFCEKGGRMLKGVATYQALSEKMENGSQWRKWSKEYQDCNSSAVAEFVASNAKRIEFFMYMLWIAERQFATIGEACLNHELAIGLYQDLAVGVLDCSAETWIEPELFAKNISLGAPPDECNPKGQEWGLSPFCPITLYDEAYKPFIKVMQANMRNAGALRIDHTIGLLRLFWVIKSQGAASGCYVSYPLDDFLGIVALESQRRKCLVVSECLGVVPKSFLKSIRDVGLLPFHLFYIEREKDRSFIASKDYPEAALSVVSSHDLATLHGFWLGRDLELFDKFDLFLTEESKQEEFEAREKDRELIIKALTDEGFLSSDVKIEKNKVPDGLVEAAYKFLASTKSKLVMVQLEDIFGQIEQMNLPGTYLEYPNWRRKLPVKLEDFLSHERLRLVCKNMNDERL